MPYTEPYCSFSFCCMNCCCCFMLCFLNIRKKSWENWTELLTVLHNASYYENHSYLKWARIIDWMPCPLQLNILIHSIFFLCMIAVHREWVPAENKSWPWQALSVSPGWSNLGFCIWYQESIHPQSVTILPCSGWTWPWCHAWSAGRSAAPSD